MELGIALLKGLCELCQRLRCPLTVLRAAAAVIQVSDLEDSFMEQLLLLALPVMRCLAPEGRCPCRLRAAPQSTLLLMECGIIANKNQFKYTFAETVFVLDSPDGLFAVTVKEAPKQALPL